MRWLWQILTKPGWRKLCQPQYVYRRLSEIDLANLQNVRVVIIDTDGVITTLGSRRVSGDNAAQVGSWHNNGTKLYLMTFNPNNEHAKTIGKSLRLRVICGETHNPTKTITDLFASFRAEGIRPEQIAIINDSLFCLGLFRLIAPECITVFISDSLGFTHYHFLGSMLMRAIFAFETMFLRRRSYRT